MANRGNKEDFLEPVQLQQITAPVLLVIGDKDIIDPEYAHEMIMILNTKLVVATDWQ
jgi:pimeloyl-ACP methyl ester carboxylesterase